ncbi:MAG TPA: NYN domain-containing protein [Hyphomicrobiaceae bacterium]|nr:NYN domain-containing protein [Hyphomicrobiaceae bacterium]
MTHALGQSTLTALFVDYDNIYLSLRRRSEEAAKRFAKDAGIWLKEIESGRLITSTNLPRAGGENRRIVMNRCYGNPVPRRNTHDNSTDMSSFPFVRHHFLRAGFEVVDCPPLTAQLKNSSDIRIVMDVLDHLDHDTRFEEFIILSGDADFTTVLHRLRAHARRTIIYANDYTAAPYTAICDGEVREADLLTLLLEGRIAGSDAIVSDVGAGERLRNEIIGTVASAVRAAGGPVPLETLAERTTRALGHDRTIGSGWAGAGSFLELLRRSLPEDIRLTDQPPYLAFEAKRGIASAEAPFEMREAQSRREAAPLSSPALGRSPSLGAPEHATSYSASRLQDIGVQLASAHRPTPTPHQSAAPTMRSPQPAAAGSRGAATAPSRAVEQASAVQQSITRIHEACQAPPLSPAEYRTLFEVMAKEINDGGLQGTQTLANIESRARALGIDVRRDDVRFILEVVSEADPWFEQGASANLFAGRFRNFVVARCRSQGLNLSTEELDLIEAWFAGTGTAVGAAPQPAPQGQPYAASGPSEAEGMRAWGDDDLRSGQAEPSGEEFPKILRTRLRG